MDDKHDRQLQRLRDWYRGLTEEERNKRRAAQREYHREKRLVAKDEINAYKRRKRAENPERANTKQREYYAAHGEQFREYRKRWRAKNRDHELAQKKANKVAINRQRAARRLKQPKTQEWHERQAFFKEHPAARLAYYRHGKLLAWPVLKGLFLRANSGPCDICGAMKNGNKPRFYLDHGHKNGNYRGILCQKCNSALGLFGDDPAMLRNAADYLERQV